MQIIISDDVKSAITDIFNYSFNISANYANRIVNKIYDAIYDLQNSPYIGRYVRYIFCSRQISKLFFKVHEKKLFEFFNHLFN